MNLDMINKRLKIISDQHVELKKIKDLYQESLENDPVFQDLQEEAKTFREQNKEKKIQVTEKESLKHIADQIKELSNDIKENKDILAQELADYYKDSGSMEITDEDGNTKRIIFSVKLVNS